MPIESRRVPKDDDRMEAGELVRREVVIIVTPRSYVRVLRLGTSIPGGRTGTNETQPIRRSDFASAPCLGQGNRGVGIHQAGIWPV